MLEFDIVLQEFLVVTHLQCIKLFFCFAFGISWTKLRLEEFNKARKVAHPIWFFNLVNNVGLEVLEGCSSKIGEGESDAGMVGPIVVVVGEVQFALGDKGVEFPRVGTIEGVGFL